MKCNISSIVFVWVAAVLIACGSDDSVSTPINLTESSDAKIVTYSSSSVKKVLSSSSKVMSSSSATVAIATELSYGKLIDERDGKEYKTIAIGDQVWMAENLNYVSDSSFCYGQNVGADYCEKYGRLYTYDDAATACPKGYRLPSLEDFAIMLRPLSDAAYEERLDKKYLNAVFAIKSVTDWEECPLDFVDDNGEIVQLPEATNSTGFSVLPAGYRNTKQFYGVEKESYFWCTTDGPDSDTKYAMEVEYRAFAVGFYWWEKNYAYSVRCIKE